MDVVAEAVDVEQLQRIFVTVLVLRGWQLLARPARPARRPSFYLEQPIPESSREKLNCHDSLFSNRNFKGTAFDGWLTSAIFPDMGFKSHIR